MKNLMIILFALLSACLLIGCEKVTSKRPLPGQSYLETPSGRYTFRPISEKEASDLGIQTFHHLYLLAESPNAKVLFSCGGKLWIGSQLEGKAFFMDADQSTYTHAGQSGPAITYPFPPVSRALRQPWYSSTITNTEEFKKFELKIVYVEPAEDLHQFKFPFSLDGDPYVAYLPVEVETYSFYKHQINVPGTP